MVRCLISACLFGSVAVRPAFADHIFFSEPDTNWSISKVVSQFTDKTTQLYASKDDTTHHARFTFECTESGGYWTFTALDTAYMTGQTNPFFFQYRIDTRLPRSIPVKVSKQGLASISDDDMKTLAASLAADSTMIVQIGGTASVYTFNMTGAKAAINGMVSECKKEFH